VVALIKIGNQVSLLNQCSCCEPQNITISYELRCMPN